MVLSEVGSPTVTEVPIRGLADHLRLASGFSDDGSQDALLENYLRAAMSAIEARLGLALLTKEYVCTLTGWRDDHSQRLPIGPIQSVSKVKLIGTDGAETLLDPNSWSVMRDARRPRLVGKFGRRLPAIPRDGHVEIQFVAGFSDNWESVPADLRQAVYLLAAHYYENSAGSPDAVAAMPFGVLMLTDPYRSMSLGGCGA
ncbi:head-tail connector protein [Amaricoccus tamworthensis]|uniref:head-tail connector protein n=1 Tax=Amaricoccus tamworthensis TaxID=57002 RepID=UPI003C7BA353